MNYKYVKNLRGEREAVIIPLEVWVQLQRHLKSVLEESEFWEVIDKLDWEGESTDQILAPAVNFLATFSLEKIRGFEEVLAHKLYLLDGETFAMSYFEENYLSPDVFLYARCFVVAQGEKYFSNVVASPDKMPQNVNFEALLTLAASAFDLKTEGTVAYDQTPTQYNYETYGNQKAWNHENSPLAFLFDE